MWPEVSQAKSENKREIKLSGAEISERITANGLDSSIFALESLNLLNISETALTTIPDDLAKLCNLQTLLLYDNQITAVPAAIGQLDKLKVLDLSRNRIAELPESITQLVNLNTINVSHNVLKSIPALRGAAKLTVLNASHNQLTQFPDICVEENRNLAEILLMDNGIGAIPHAIEQLAALKQLSMVRNQVKTIPKSLATITKLKDLELVENPISDKRLLKLIQQCRTKQVLDYVKKNGEDKGADDAATKQTPSKATNSKKRESVDESAHKIVVTPHSTEDFTVIYDSSVEDIRPYILCCIVTNANLGGEAFRSFLQLQTRLHETVCGKREKSTIATHDFAKLVLTEKVLRYKAIDPRRLRIHPLGKAGPHSGQDLYDGLKRDAEALRKEKKRNVYSGIHRYLYLLENKERFPLLEDGAGNAISLPPLTNSELTKISPETTKLLIEVTSSTSMTDCRQTIEQLLKQMLLAGLGRDADNSGRYILDVTQIKITDADGNLRTVYPSKSDLVVDKSERIVIERN